MSIDRRISALPLKTSLALNDVFPILDVAETKNKKATLQAILDPSFLYTDQKVAEIQNAQLGAPICVKLILTQQHLDNKQIVLAITPSVPGAVTLVPDEGIPQVNGKDFEVTGNILSWEGLGLEGFLELGELLIIQY
jgi:hypothetical protein